MGVSYLARVIATGTSTFHDGASTAVVQDGHLVHLFVSRSTATRQELLAVDVLSNKDQRAAERCTESENVVGVESHASACQHDTDRKWSQSYVSP